MNLESGYASAHIGNSLGLPRSPIFSQQCRHQLVVVFRAVVMRVFPIAHVSDNLQGTEFIELSQTGRKKAGRLVKSRLGFCLTVFQMPFFPLYNILIPLCRSKNLIEKTSFQKYAACSKLMIRIHKASVYQIINTVSEK